MSAYHRLMTLFNTDGMPAARRYRFAREAAGLKQNDLAQILGVARTTVGEWESGRTEPAASKLVMLAQATNQPLDWFAEGLREEWRARRDSNPQPSDLEFARSRRVAARRAAGRQSVRGGKGCQGSLDGESIYLRAAA